MGERGVLKQIPSGHLGSLEAKGGNGDQGGTVRFLRVQDLKAEQSGPLALARVTGSLGVAAEVLRCSGQIELLSIQNTLVRHCEGPAGQLCVPRPGVEGLRNIEEQGDGPREVLTPPQALRPRLRIPHPNSL